MSDTNGPPVKRQRSEVEEGETKTLIKGVVRLDPARQSATTAMPTHRLLLLLVLCCLGHTEALRATFLATIPTSTSKSSADTAAFQTPSSDRSRPLFSTSDTTTAATAATTAPEESSPDVHLELKKKRAKVGIVRLDGALYAAPTYDKEAVVGDIASSDTFVSEQAGIVAIYLRAEGYTFDVCKYGLEEPYAQNKTGVKFVREGRVKIRGSQDLDTHMFVPSRCLPGELGKPRKRQPSRIEPWLDETNTEIGSIYVYESDLLFQNLRKCIRDLVQEGGARAIASACGFMADVQEVCVEAAGDGVPCIMSSLELLDFVQACVKGKILILTASAAAFEESYGQLVDPAVDKKRLLIVGLEDIDGFGSEVAAGSTVDPDKAEKGILEVVREAIKAEEDDGDNVVSAIVSECTELPGYTNTLRRELKIPVFDALSVCNLVMHALLPTRGLGSHPHHKAASYDA